MPADLDAKPSLVLGDMVGLEEEEDENGVGDDKADKHWDRDDDSDNLDEL